MEQLNSIVNVKAAVQSRESLVDIRNHNKDRVKLYPNSKVNAPWSSDSTITFTLNSAEMPYINLNSSILWYKVGVELGQQPVDNLGAPVADAFSITPLSGALINKRLRIINAGNVLDDIDEYGRYVQILRDARCEASPPDQYHGSVTWEPCAVGDTRAGDASDLLELDNAYGLDENNLPTTPFWSAPNQGNHGMWIAVPFITPLDGFQPTSYLPMYMLATKLNLEFTIAKMQDFIVLTREEPGEVTYTTAVAAWADMKFQLLDAYIEVHGLRVVDGAILSPIPFTMKTLGIQTYKNELTTNKTQCIKNSDISKSALKDAIHWFRTKHVPDDNCVEVGFVGDTSEHVRFLDSSSLSDLAETHYVFPEEFSGRLGGTLYPFPTPLSAVELFFEFDRWRQQVDNTKIPVSMQSPKYGPATFLKHHFAPNNQFAWDLAIFSESLIPIVNYSHLDQTNSIISGMDTERYDVSWEMVLNRVPDENKDWITYCEFWRIVTWAGGKINYEQ